ncbi:MAG: hypothetical protein HOW97_33435 [Catenulispora sp.]|nr:hypothetical protein [Catenulispora sp.]
MHHPSRRQSLLILSGLGAAAVAGGAYLLESHGSSNQPYDPHEGAPPERPIAPPTPIPGGEDVNWRPSAFGFKPSNDHVQQIKGYASATSVGRGESIDFHVTVSPAQKFRIKIFRLGQTSADRASDLVATSPELAGVTQDLPQVVAPTRTVLAPWSASWRLDVPADWASGLYMATFENEAKFRSVTPFVVRDDHNGADLLVVLPFTTYQAYNMYPWDEKLGSSLYHAWTPTGQFGSTDICSTRVSFDRPYVGDGIPTYFDLDYAFVSWVEAQPYTVSYASGIDLHAGRVDPTKYKALVFSGHDEYWSSNMRSTLEYGLDKGVSAAFMAANNLYWRIRMDASAGGVEHRQVTCYKERKDPGARSPQSRTNLWRLTGEPEQSVLGAMYRSVVTDAKPQPLVVDSADHWFWKGTGVRNGERIPNLVAGEADQVWPGQDGPDVTYLAVSPFTGNGKADKPTKMPAHTVLYQRDSGAWVFNAGTFYWNHGLSTPGFADSRIQAATRNLLNRMTTRR